ncbi:hypothetical protein GGX14DRAFT_354385 [Mycena pura]|uniref:Uncharacterized protein n=1 Tax=Mycena pura TaxID=153505 RepID=A0AAD6YKJ0_9AGAR|nr:hypothetical protein GGX14DRAFT_354385 [Mycena pura]
MSKNAFSELLRPYGAEMFPLLVVDLMHEFELGVWKAVFIHIIRILHTLPNAVVIFDESNASERKKLAARDYEDYLQNLADCFQTIIPVIEHLLPEPFNGMIMTMLFRLAEWHALAKLRMHTDDTLTRFKKSTTVIGKELRQFHAEPRGKFLNLATYKFHAIGDYPSTIPFVGTTDSFSTQIGELAHRLLKRLYRRTNKRNAIKQMAKLERRQIRLQKAREAADSPRKRHAHHIPFSQTRHHENTGVDVHHYISPSQNHRTNLYSFVNDKDPAKEDFIPKLKDHLLGRLLHRDFDGDEEQFSEEERATVRINNNSIYSVGTMRVNYTTYDMRRDQDTINPRTHPDVIVLSAETGRNAHPFWYARVLGIFYADVVHKGPQAQNHGTQRMEFLRVRWFGVVPGYKSGFKVARLPKLGFVSYDDENTPAFGFLDPSLVLRGCYIVPAFADGKTTMLLPTVIPTVARPIGETEEWKNYYAIM